jgi:uncharacterized membrane protein
MALDGWFENTLFILRWIHILAGITWIGLLYFFNFVNVPFQGKLPADIKPKVNPELLPRALWWFRWGAMVTFVIGLLLLLLKYGHGNMWLDADGNLAGRTIWILIGALLGTIMWFNVWFIIWPAQKQIIGWVKAGTTHPEMPALAKRGGFFSRVNTYLSGPMLFCMIAPNNYGAFSIPTFVIVTAIALVTVHLLIKKSFTSGSTI